MNTDRITSIGMHKRSLLSFHAKKHVRNSHLLESIAYVGNSHIETSIDIVQYNTKEFHLQTITSIDEIKPYIKSGISTWVKITGISDAELIMNIGKQFGIKRFDIKDLLANHYVTKVIPYPQNTFVLMAAAQLNSEGEIELERIAFILGENYIISFQERISPIFDDVLDAIKNSRVQIRERGADYLLYILLSCVNSAYNDIIINTGNKINKIEDVLVEGEYDNADIMRFIQDKKKDYSVLKRIIYPLREEYNNLLHNTNSLIQESNKMYFNDFEDRLRIASEDIERLRDATYSLTDLYFNNNNLRMNRIIQKLTIVSTVFIPLTFMVGVWGMNFEFMPELKWEYGYIYAWGVMVLIVLLAVFFLKRKKWF